MASLCSLTSSPPAIASSVSRIQVVMIDVEAWSPEQLIVENLLEHLQSEERQRVLRFRVEIDKLRSLVGRILLRWMAHIALRVPWERLDFQRTEENKPYLSSPKRSCFNLNVSHHGKWVAGACDERVLVGVDVMRYERPRGCSSIHDFFDTMRQYFTPYEWEDIEREPEVTCQDAPATTKTTTTTTTTTEEEQKEDTQKETTSPQEMLQLQQFYRHWALKESYIKAVGIGLGFELSRCEFRYVDKESVVELPNGKHAVMYIDGVLQTNWKFTIHEPDVEHCVVVALGPLKEATPHFLESLLPLPKNDPENECELDLEFVEKKVSQLRRKV